MTIKSTLLEVAIPSKVWSILILATTWLLYQNGNALDLATYIGFNDLKAFNEGWSQNPKWTVLSLQAHVQQENPAISLAGRFGTGKHVWKLSTHAIIGRVLVVGALENIAEELEIFVSQRNGLTMVV